jgi:DNA-binding NarL/FixJ family response regulator
MIDQDSVLQLLSDGYKHDEIAKCILKSKRAVQLHIEKLKDKNNCKNIPQLMFIYGLKKGSNLNIIADTNRKC